jgi:hypothetical protein
VRTDNDGIRQLQDATDVVLSAVTSKALLDGNFLQDVVITGGTVLTINHRLGRKLLGWIICRKNLEVDVWDSQASNPTPNATLILNATDSGDPLNPNVVTISLWVF